MVYIGAKIRYTVRYHRVIFASNFFGSDKMVSKEGEKIYRQKSKSTVALFKESIVKIDGSLKMRTVNSRLKA